MIIWATVCAPTDALGEELAALLQKTECIWGNPNYNGSDPQSLSIFNRLSSILNNREPYECTEWWRSAWIPCFPRVGSLADYDDNVEGYDDDENNSSDNEESHYANIKYVDDEDKNEDYFWKYNCKSN